MFRTRLSAALAAVALIAASVFAGSVAATAAPPPPVITTPSASTTDTTAPLISGTVEHTDSVAQEIEVLVTLDGVTSSYCTTSLYYEPTGTEAWNCPGVGTLAYGVYTFTAVTWEDPGDVSAASAPMTYTVGGTQSVTVANPTPGATTPDATPTFSGTGPSLGTVTIATGTTTLCTATVTAAGNWSCTSSPLSASDGSSDDTEETYTITPSAIQADGVPQTGGNQSLTIILPFAPTIDYYYAGTPPWQTGNTQPWMQGTMSPATASVTVFQSTDGTSWDPYCAAATDPEATVWYCTSPVGVLEPGVNILAAEVTNEADDLSGFGPQITVELVSNPTITSISDGEHLNDSTPTIAGAAAFGTSYTVYKDSGPGAGPFLCTGTVALGAYTCTTPSLPDGSYQVHTYMGQGIDVSSPTVSFVIDTVAPAAPEIFTTGVVNDVTPAIRGTGEPYAAITVFIDGEAVTCDSWPVGHGETGDWECVPSVPLSLGAHSVSAAQVDQAGNRSSIGVPPVMTTITVEPPLTPPTPVIVAPTSGSTTYSTSVVVEGTIENSFSQEFYIEVTAVGPEGPTSCATSLGATQTTWACLLPLAPGTNSISAVAYFTADYPNNAGLASAPVTVTRATTIPKPTLSYDLGPATIGITGSSMADGDISLSFYRVTGNAGAYGYDFLDGCGTGGGGGEGGGEGGEGEGASGIATPVASTAACSYSGLTPGIYNVYAQQLAGSLSSEFQNDYIAIPATPTLADAAVNTDRTVTFAGVGTPAQVVLVQSLGGSVACSVTVDGAGLWSCTAALPAGTASFRAIQQSSGFVANTGDPSDVPDLSIQGYSAYSGEVSVTVPPAPGEPPVQPTPEEPTPEEPTQPEPTTPEPEVAAAPPVPQPWTFQFGVGGGEFQPGDSTTLVGTGLPAGAAVEAEFHSTPVFLGTTSVTPTGEFSLDVTIPEDAEPGLHNFVVTITPATGLPSTQTQPVTIVLPPKALGQPGPGVGLGQLPTAAVGDARNDPSAPSSFTHSLDTIQSVLSNPAVIGGAAFAGFVLLLLVAFPAELLNSTISENYGRLAKRLPRASVPWWERFENWLEKTPLFGALAITIVAAFIFGFADPGFGFDITSFRLVLACAIALFIVGYVASSLSGLIIRRRWGLATHMELKPLGLVLTIVGVVLSRLLEFSPGFLLGLILGLSIVGTTTAAQRAKATLVQAGVVFVLALLGWVGYSILTAVSAPDTFGTALAFDTMVAVTAEGLTALFIGLLPFRLLDGEALFAHNKVVWAVTYVIAAAAFVLIVVPAAWGEVNGSLVTWLIVLGGFAVVAVGLYLFFRFTSRDDEGGEQSEESPERESVDA